MRHIKERLPFALALALALAAGPAAAQSDGEIEDPTAPRQVEEVIHGFYTHLRMGMQFFVAGPVASDTANIKGSGLSTGFGIGFDITDWFAPELCINFGVNSRDTPDPRKPSQFEILGSNMPSYSAQLRLNFAFPFSERFRIAGNVGGGVLTTFDNENVFGSIDRTTGKPKKEITAAVLPMFGVAVGVEYYTSLRHFSIGFMIEYFHVLGDVNSGALALLPTVKYTF